MGVAKITPFTTTDYEGHTACVLYFAGCNMRCLYCYNHDIVLARKCLETGKIEEFLRSRARLLDAVVFSGGECSLSPIFLPLLRLSKKLGFKNKIDTNGTNINILINALKEGLIDFVSLDFKAPFDKYKLVSGVSGYDKFISTFKLLKANKTDFEIRTTVHTELLSEADISIMASELASLGYSKTYYLQGFYAANGFGFKKPLNPNPDKLNINLINSPIRLELRNFD